MKAVQLIRQGGPEVIATGTADVPLPADGEVLVRICAAGVTPTELLWAPTWTTANGEPRPLPVIPGHEFSGTVHAVGKGVSDLAAGDAVFGANDWFADGAQAEFCIARASDLLPKPKSIRHVEAAAVPITALTAWQGLVERAELRRNERVLIHGGAGGVGHCAVQIARSLGAYVITTASRHNGDFVRGLGADEVIFNRERRFEEVARDFDVVFDTVGGDTLLRAEPLLRPGGRMVTIAADAEQSNEPRIKDAFFIVEPNRERLMRVTVMIDAGELQPVIYDVFPLEEARTAYERKPLRGKVVLSVCR
jgi:NADPH:quinone reductase-like Zn-dependent oxidoreductase